MYCGFSFAEGWRTKAAGMRQWPVCSSFASVVQIDFAPLQQVAIRAIASSVGAFYDRAFYTLKLTDLYFAVKSCAVIDRACRRPLCKAASTQGGVAEGRGGSPIE